MLRIALVLIAGIALTGGSSTNPPPGWCATWVGTPRVLREGRLLVSDKGRTWRSRRVIYDVHAASAATVRIARDSATCAQAVAAYTSAREKGVSGPPDSVSLRLVVVRGRDFFLVEDSLSAAGATDLREVAVFYADWRYHMSYGSGS